MLRALGAAVVCLLVGGCAIGGRVGSDPAVERGRAFAEQRCAGCHAVTLDERPGSSGPRFRDIQRRNNSLSLEHSLIEITRHGHADMPPLEFSGQQARDIAAYIESLRVP